MKLLRVGDSYFVDAADVEILQPWGTRPAAAELKRAKEAGHFYDATSGKRILSIITLKTGWVVATQFTPEALANRPVISAPTKASTRRAAAGEEREVPMPVLDGAGSL